MNIPIRAWAWCALAIAIPAIAIGQTATLSATSPDSTVRDIPLTATQMTAAGYVSAMEAFAWSDMGTPGMHPVINGHLTMHHDSVAVLVDSLARVWVHALHQRGTLPPRELISQAALEIEVGHDADARRDIETWIRTPGVSQRDSINAFKTAVELFTRTFDFSAPSPARMQMARDYIARLEAMPREAAASDLAWVRFVMVGAYARAGEADSAAAIGLRGYAACQQIPAWDRRAMCAAGEYILDVTHVLSGQPHGLAQIDSLLTALKREFVVPPALLAKDTALGRLAMGLRGMFAQSEAKLRWFGHPAPPVVATHWFNQPTPKIPAAGAPGARALPLTDGTIRIIGFGWFTCGACRRAMKHMQQDQTLLPRGVQLMYVEWTQGFWGSDLVEPAEEVEHLRHYWLDKKKYTFPFAIWAGPKDSTADGGLLPRALPTAKALRIDAGPTFIVVDGHGVIRHWQQGYYTYTHDFDRVIKKLVRERDQAAKTPAVLQ